MAIARIIGQRQDELIPLGARQRCAAPARMFNARYWTYRLAAARLKNRNMAKAMSQGDNGTGASTAPATIRKT